jgi:hypothetical protein
VRRLGDLGIKPVAAFFSISLGILPLAHAAVSTSSGAVLTPSFKSDSRLSSQNGYFRLDWENTAQVSTEFELQQSTDSLFSTGKTRYRGPQHASFFSGLSNGLYYYRVRAYDKNSVSEWSSMVRVEVEHPSMTLAWTLFGLGFIVFAATGWVILFSSKSDDDDSDTSLNPNMPRQSGWKGKAG